MVFVFFFQAEDGIRDDLVTGVQTCALPIWRGSRSRRRRRSAQRCARRSLVTSSRCTSTTCRRRTGGSSESAWGARQGAERGGERDRGVCQVTSNGPARFAPGRRSSCEQSPAAAGGGPSLFLRACQTGAAPLERVMTPRLGRSLTAAALLSATAATPIVAQAARSDASTHTVKRGDTLWD